MKIIKEKHKLLLEKSNEKSGTDALASKRLIKLFQKYKKMKLCETPRNSPNPEKTSGLLIQTSFSDIAIQMPDSPLLKEEGIVSEDIHEIITTLIEQDYLVLNPAKNISSNLDLLDIGKQAINMYTDSVYLLPETSRRKFSWNSLASRPNLKTLKSQSTESENLFDLLTHVND